MSLPNYVNNNFHGKIGEKSSYNYYMEAKSNKKSTVEEEIKRIECILGVENEKGVQFVDDYWTKVFLQNDEEEFCGGIKLILNKEDSLYSESNVAKTLEFMATNILKLDQPKDDEDKIKVYDDEELFKQAIKEQDVLSHLTRHLDSEIGVNEDKFDLLVLANQKNYKMEKRFATMTKSDLDVLHKKYGEKYKVVDDYYKAYLDYYNLRKMYIEKSKVKKLTKQEKRIFTMICRNLKSLKEDFVDSIYKKVRPILFKAPLPDEGYRSYEELDMLDRTHMIELLRLHREMEIVDFQRDLNCILFDLNQLIEKCKLTRIQRNVLRLFVQGLTQEQIGEQLGMKQPVVNQHINSMLTRIMNKYEEQLEDWYYLNVRYGKYKKCKACGEIKLISKFGKEPKGLFGVKAKCKDCINKK